MSWQNIFGATLVFLVCLFEILLVLKKKRKWLLSMPMVLWMIHSFAFLVSNWSMMDKLKVNSWSQNLRLQGYITILFLAIYRYVRYMMYKSRKGGENVNGKSG